MKAKHIVGSWGSVLLLESQLLVNGISVMVLIFGTMLECADFRGILYAACLQADNLQQTSTVGKSRYTQQDASPTSLRGVLLPKPRGLRQIEKRLAAAPPQEMNWACCIQIDTGIGELQIPWLFQ